MRDGRVEILVVDDEQTLRQIVSRALEKLGHHCTTAENGQEAIELGAASAFDLIITDLKMPKMDGLSLIERVRAERPELPIIIMTGYADIDSARKALRLRVSDYLVKPFESLAEVQAAVQRALTTRSSRLGADSLVREFEDRAREFERREHELTQNLERAEDEVKALAEKLERSEAVAGQQVEQIETMIANVENGILVSDTGGGVLSLNQELRRQLQAPNLSGKGLSVDRLPGDSALRETILESVRLVRAGSQEPVTVETTDARGQPCLYEVRSARLIGPSGEAVGIVTTVAKVRGKPAGV